MNAVAGQDEQSLPESEPVLKHSRPPTARARRYWVPLAALAILGLEAAAKFTEPPEQTIVRLQPAPESWNAPFPAARIAVIGDVQKGLACCVNMLNEIARVEPRPSVLVFTGDMVSHADAGHYALFLRALDAGLASWNPKPACFFVPGNHDLQPEGSEPARRDLYAVTFTAPPWSAQVGQTLLLGLDAAFQPATAADWAWVAQTSAGKAATLVFLHVPPQGDWALGTQGPRLVVAGHAHEYREETSGLARLIVNGEGCDDPAGLPHGRARYLLVDVDGEGIHVESRFVDKRRDAAWLGWDLRHGWIAHLAPVASSPEALAFSLVVLAMLSSRLYTAGASRRLAK